MVPAFPVYLFDIDGTLLDSAPDITGAIRTVLAQHPPVEVSDAFLRSFIGHHLTDCFRELYPHYTAEQIDGMVQEYRRVYPLRGHASTRPYPGVTETIGRLGGRKSTATTKGTPTARIVLEKFGLLPHFEHVQGTDGFPSKPAPDVIFRSFEALGVRPEDCLLVGDAAPDMEAGRKAGVKLCAVRYGYGDQRAMAEWEPDFWIDDLRELLPGG
jgi:HAD superfamily hydrolase (TIGR01509 family)